ncbi:sugar phosphate isomerase/epimerase [Clostridium sp. HBUAS56010]|uniref:sugar phosphate isomerase/epimerase family protein n=1 Tax=Clostridium sp. HBUAS56010 TaxID=2571127 RepID=UPI00163DDFE9|nr:sugar phosphate isomerase/epimerase [Clostridium sp. HBUAS56010]
MIIPGMVSATFRDQSADEVLRLCRLADLKGIEWSEHAHVFPEDLEGARKLGEQTRKEGLMVAAYGSYFRLGNEKEPEEAFLKSVKAAAALGAPIIRIWAGTKPSAQVGKEEFSNLCKEAKAVAEIAASHGIKTAFEWHKDTLTDTNDSAMELLKKADHDNLYCLWQPTAALSMEERVRGIDLLGSRLLNLHIYYWADGKKFPLEEGKALWQQYFDHVDQTVCRYGLLEFVKDGKKEQFLEDAKVLHDMLNNQEREKRKE